MPADGDAASRLDAAMEKRRSELREEWKIIADRAGISEYSIRRIRNGEPSRSITKAKIERALGWTPGSIDKILAGGDPQLLPDRSGPVDWTVLHPPEAEIEAVIGHWGQLSEFSRRWVIRTMEEAAAELKERRMRREASGEQEG